ncbi:hypothetical protein FWH13_00785 [Candidatus Saccharibacteria bacterium]|nr:hypothetical protein [Candidatus Saccharibacteria bacterium]
MRDSLSELYKANRWIVGSVLGILLIALVVVWPVLVRPNIIITQVGHTTQQFVAPCRQPVLTINSRSGLYATREINTCVGHERLDGTVSRRGMLSIARRADVANMLREIERDPAPRMVMPRCRVGMCEPSRIYGVETPVGNAAMYYFVDEDFMSDVMRLLREMSHN